MPLPAPKPRSANHLRTFRYEAFHREDGLWDIDATVQDSKHYTYYEQTRGELRPGDFLHNISVRVTFDNAFNVHGVETSMDDIPFSYCQGGAANVDKLVGANLMKGWRKVLNESLGLTNGCTHLKETLQNTATVAFQTISAFRDNTSPEKVRRLRNAEERPFYIDGCHSMATDGPVVARFFTKFATPGERDDE